MAYQGKIIEIPIGMDGLRTDDPDSKVSPSTLVRALNINLQSGYVEKDYGSRRWNSSALPGGVVGGFDWNPDDITQRMIVACNDGKIYRFTDAYNYSEVSTSATIKTINTSEMVNFVSAGGEESGNDKKLFIFSGASPIQVITADGTTRRNISNPAPEWTGTNHPVDGIIHNGRVWAIPRSGHYLLVSSALDHEDFSTTPVVFNIAPGEGEKLSGGFIFRGKLFIYKYPRGLYVLVDDDPDINNQYFAKITDAFGAPTSRSALAVFNDLLIANEYGSITSLTATNATGDVNSSDFFANLRVQKFVRETINQEGRNIRQCIYYQDKKIVMFTYRKKTSTQNDVICYVDFQDPNRPRILWNDKDQPNCLFLYKDVEGQQKPMYGANDGYVYQMDQTDRWVGVGSGSPQTAFKGEFWTPHIDFGNGDPISENNKNFDFVGVKYIPTGDYKLFCDVFCDGIFQRTLSFKLKSYNDLDMMQLDSDSTDSESEREDVQSCSMMGRRIQLRFYNEGLGENFKIVAVRIYLNPSGQQKFKKG